MSRSAVVVFAKVPEPGRVKTRLLPQLTPERAAEVHRACLEDTVRLVGRIPGSRKCLQVAAEFDRARQLAATLELDHQWQVAIQRGRDLGERLEETFRSLFRAGYRRVVIVGTDTPWMGAQRIRRALALLDTTDVVLGPCADGGYYLVGARRLYPQMFCNIPWSTSQVLSTTTRVLEKARASYGRLPRDFDLDRPEDLARAAEVLRRNETRAPALAKLLGNLLRRPVSRSSRRRPSARRNKTRRPAPA